ncbi:MAG TPA: hypothetical protein VGC09_04825 [Rhodopila sp.]
MVFPRQCPDEEVDFSVAILPGVYRTPDMGRPHATEAEEANTTR